MTGRGAKNNDARGSATRYGGLRSPYVLRGIALGYVGLMVALPILALSVRAFGDGLGTLWESVRRPDALYSLELTVLMALAMVVVNVVMGTLTAWVLVRYRFPGQSLVNMLIDLPFAVPTVVTGLMLVILYGPQSSVGRFLTSRGVEVIYAKPASCSRYSSSRCHSSFDPFNRSSWDSTKKWKKRRPPSGPTDGSFSER